MLSSVLIQRKCADIDEAGRTTSQGCLCSFVAQGWICRKQCMNVRGSFGDLGRAGLSWGAWATGSYVEPFYLGRHKQKRPTHEKFCFAMPRSAGWRWCALCPHVILLSSFIISCSFDPALDNILRTEINSLSQTPISQSSLPSIRKKPLGELNFLFA